MMLVLGVGGIQPNEDSDGDDEPAVLKSHAWMSLLKENDGVLSLRPPNDPLVKKANKTNIANALREIMRQAWGKIIFNNYISNLITVIQRIQAGVEKSSGRMLQKGQKASFILGSS